MEKSFSLQTKEELSKHKFGDNFQLLAEISAFAYSCGVIKLSRNKFSLEFFSENEDSITRQVAIIKRLYGISPKISVTEKTQPKRYKSYSFEIKHNADEGKLLFDIGILRGTVDDYEFGEINESIFTRDGCFEALLRGAFLGCGILSDPNKQYHLEFVFANSNFAEYVLKLLTDKGFNANINYRGDRSVVYIKKFENISDILISIGATKAMMDIENIRVFKEVKGNINREDNCIIGNMNKTISACQRQINEINLLFEKDAYLTPSLREACELRLKYRDASLAELANLSGISKSALNKRFIKIHSISTDYEEKNL